jgi:hypothetical protein
MVRLHYSRQIPRKLYRPPLRPAPRTTQGIRDFTKIVRDFTKIVREESSGKWDFTGYSWGVA